MSCLDESCSRLDIIKISADDKQATLLGSYDLEEYLGLMTKLEKKEKLKLKNHFFPIDAFDGNLGKKAKKALALGEKFKN